MGRRFLHFGKSILFVVMQRACLGRRCLYFGWWKVWIGHCIRFGGAEVWVGRPSLHLGWWKAWLRECVFFLGCGSLVGMAALASRVTELSARGEELQVCKAPGRLGKAVDPAFYTDAETFFGRASASKPCPKSSF